MIFPESSWIKYIRILAAINSTAAKKFTAYLNTHDVSTSSGRQAAIEYAFAIATQYGETAAAAACEMYDAVAEASGVALPPAEPAPTAPYSDVAKAVNGLKKQNMSNELIGEAVARLVKRAGADTTLRNALRDGAEFAWIPHGDTCAFCLILASNGWRRASKKVIKGDHAQHIHANCDCTFAIRFDGKSKVEGYDPEKYREMYDNAEGNTWKEKMNSMRREQYSKNGDQIRAQKREAYASRKQRLDDAATIDAVGKSGKSVIDYSDARNFAGDNVRLQNMLRSQDAQQISDAVNIILNESYDLPKSVWNGRAEVVPDGSLGAKVLGKARWNRTIAICESSKNDLSVHIHEQLHMRSINRYGEIRGKQLLLSNRGTEEGTIELLTQEICKSKNITSSERYSDYVEQLRYIRKVVQPQESDLDFARKLIDMPVERRYSYLESIVSDYKSSNDKIRAAVVVQLDNALSELGR